MTRLRPPQHRSAVIGAQRTVQYYESVLDEFHSRRKTENTIRLFLAPGMDHCGAFESGLSSWDRLEPLVKWVENGIAPDRIVAAQTVKGAVIRTRPLCPYPQEARWTGQGSTDEAVNFVCARPRENEEGPGHGHGGQHGSDDD